MQKCYPTRLAPMATDWLDRDRVERAPELKRIVVTIDPAVTSGEGADETGIIVAGIDADRHGYVLEDLSGRYQPHEWAAVAIAATDDTRPTASWPRSITAAR